MLDLVVAFLLRRMQRDEQEVAFLCIGERRVWFKVAGNAGISLLQRGALIVALALAGVRAQHTAPTAALAIHAQPSEQDQQRHSRIPPAVQILPEVDARSLSQVLPIKVALVEALAGGRDVAGLRLDDRVEQVKNLLVAAHTCTASRSCIGSAASRGRRAALASADGDRGTSSRTREEGIRRRCHSPASTRRSARSGAGAARARSAPGQRCELRPAAPRTRAKYRVEEC